MSRGPHAKPSPTAQAAAPVAAAIGTLVMMSPSAASPRPGRPATTKTLRADALIGRTAQQTCAVRPGDTLTSIARRFYGNPVKRHQIYQASTFGTSNPGLSCPGPKLTIPGLRVHPLLRHMPRVRLGGGGRLRRRAALPAPSHPAPWA